MGFSMEADFGDFSTKDLLAKFELLPGQKVQKVIDRAVIDWCVPYCPWRTGKLAMSPYTDTDIGSGVIEYGVDYAEEVYYGEDIISFNTEINPLAGSFWFERAMADHMQDVYDAALKAAKEV